MKNLRSPSSTWKEGEIYQDKNCICSKFRTQVLDVNLTSVQEFCSFVIQPQEMKEDVVMAKKK